MSQSVTRRVLFYFIFILFVFFLVKAGSALIQKNRPVGVGENFPNLLVNEKLSPSELKYLGISKKKEKFYLKEIKADLILIEVLNVYCPSCQTQAPIFNELFNLIEKDPKTKDRIKMIGIAAGNNETEAKSFRKRFGIAYPIIPDLKFKIIDIVGSTRAPFHIALRKSSEEMVVARAHLGRIEDYAGYFEDVSAIMTYKIAMIKKTKKGESPEPQKSLRPDIPEDKLISLVKKGMKEAGKEIKEFREIELKNREVVYMGRTGEERLFAKVASREAICDICENTHFIFVFDSKGKVVNLVPILLAKYGNKEWTKEDINKIKGRLVGRYLYNPFDFDSKVDAVSQATMTSALVFDSLERANTIYEELKEKGYVN